jgi:hypothetical protein
MDVVTNYVERYIFSQLSFLIDDLSQYICFACSPKILF